MSFSPTSYKAGMPDFEIWALGGYWSPTSKYEPTRHYWYVCEVNLNCFPTKVNLDILPLGSYDILISMDWFEQHHVMLDFLHKLILCTDSQGNQVKVQGIPKKVSVRKISILQVKKWIRKAYNLFAVNIQDIDSKIEEWIKDFPILVVFEDVFLHEILGLPPKRDLYFSIELTPGSVSASKAPYHMSALELVELKLQLQKLI